MFLFLVICVSLSVASYIGFPSTSSISTFISFISLQHFSLRLQLLFNLEVHIETRNLNTCLQLYSSNSWLSFYVYGSVHRWSVLITVQRDATQSSLFIILQVHSRCFGCQTHPSSGVHKTVTTASSSLLAWPRWREVAAQKIWPVLEAAVTVLCTPDDGRGWHPKHVEWTCRIIDCFVAHLVGQLLIQISDARNHKHKRSYFCLGYTCYLYYAIVLGKFFGCSIMGHSMSVILKA